MNEWMDGSKKERNKVRKGGWMDERVYIINKEPERKLDRERI